jgi:SAM-dependent methyltransferase
MRELYSSYSSFKGWGGAAAPVRPEEFSEILKLGRCAQPSRILEIGFGRGQFLDWARAGGHDVVGVEIIPEMIGAARSRGHAVHETLEKEIDGQFDLIVAIDVFEHISYSELTTMLLRCRQLLRSSGRLVARFPNGDSPFSGRYQNGDATHVKPMTASALGQIALPLGIEVERATNSRALPPNVGARLKRRVIYALRDLVEILIGRIYFSTRAPMDPNILVVMAPASLDR